MLSEERRREIATFLRIRRARLTPDDLQLPAWGRRRTPGLRREEVAALAGVSTEWYTWLEQARDVRPSREVLERIAAALRLEPSATQYLLTLAGHGSNGPQVRAVTITPHIQRLLDRLDPYPAWVYGERWDVVAWNRGAALLYGNFGAMQGLERNMLVQMFLRPRMRLVLVDFPRVARGIVAKVREVYARFVDDPWYKEVIDLLCRESEEFAAWWNERAVEPYEDGVKAFRLPGEQLLTFDFSVLDVRDRRFANLSLVTYVPLPGTGTLEAMQRLLRAAPVEAAVTGS
ncbi:MAG TPA: helix-turn-helix transcriptional regulator [Vicinamibacterales bacterium]